MKDQITQFLYAAGRGNLPLVRELIAKGISVNAANHNDCTPLMSACASYRVEVVKLLLQAGAEVNLRTKEGRTALHTAVGSTPSLPEEQRDCVRLLLQQGVQIDVQDASGITSLMNAAWFGCTLSVIELLKAGASLSLKDVKGCTAKELACLKKRDEIIKIIEQYER